VSVLCFECCVLWLLCVVSVVRCECCALWVLCVVCCECRVLLVLCCCVLWVLSVACCVLSGRGFCVGLITRPEESYLVWSVWVWCWSLDNEDTLTQWGLLRYGEKKNILWWSNKMWAALVEVKCYGMWRRVDWYVFTDVSKKRTGFMFRLNTAWICTGRKKAIHKETRIFNL